MNTNTRGSPVILALALLTTVVFLFQGCQRQQVSPDAHPRAEVHRLSDGRGSDSGIVLAPGVVLTAGHVAIHPGLSIDGLPTGGLPTGTTKAVDQDHDLGLLVYPANIAGCPCATLADHEAELDERVIVVGFPYGISSPIVTEGRSQGVISMPDGSIALVVTAPVAPGNSGGGVYVFRDGVWQLVGILVASTPAGAVSMAIPLSEIKAFLAANAK